MAAALNGHVQPSLGGTDAANSPIHQMQKYFGPLRNSDVETWAADQFAHETHNLPKAYEGRNKFLMATIDFLITKDDDWYTSAVLPWEYTEELHVAWNVWRFNKTMMDYEPHQGVPRYVTQESESHQDSLSRRGLAFIIEHGFWKTELGRSHYLMNLRQIVEAVHETTFFGVMMALLSADNHYEQWNAKHGTLHRSSLQRVLEDEKFLWAVVQKNIKGLFVMDAELKDRMRRQGIEPTAWIFPPKMSIYASMIPEYFNEFQRRGETAKNALETGARAFDSFRGLPVYETRTFDVDFQGDGIEPLTSARSCGEYYVMEPEDMPDGIQIFNMDTDRFETIRAHEASKHIVNPPEATTVETLVEDNPQNSPVDNVQRLGQIIAGMGAAHMRSVAAGNHWYSDIAMARMEGVHRGQLENGGFSAQAVTSVHETLSNLTGTSPHSRLLEAGIILASRLLEVAYLPDVASYPGGGGPAATGPYTPGNVGAGGGCFAFSNTDTAGGGQGFNGVDAADAAFFAGGGGAAAVLANRTGAVLALIRALEGGDNHYLRAHRILLMRPYQTYRMSDAILGRVGSELGHTFHGHHDFQLTDDIIHKVHIGHYTFYSKSIVRQPKNMYVARNVFCQGYEYGENLDFVRTNPNEQKLPNGRHRGQIQSLIAIAVPCSEDIPNPLCANGGTFRGTMPAVDVSDRELGRIPAFGGANTSVFDDTARGAIAGVNRPAVNNEGIRSYFDGSAHNATGLDDVRSVNAVCWRGASRHYQATGDSSGGYNREQKSTGHWGQHVYDGCADVRKGLYANLDPNAHVQ